MRSFTSTPILPLLEGSTTLVSVQTLVPRGMHSHRCTVLLFFENDRCTVLVRALALPAVASGAVVVAAQVDLPQCEAAAWPVGLLPTTTAKHSAAPACY